MKKIFVAIGLLPFVACVVVDDDDGDTGADTEVSSTSPTSTSPTSTSTTGDTQTSTETTDTTDPQTTGDTEDPTTGGGDGLGLCVTNCETFEDCCEAQGIPMDQCMGEGLGGYSCDDNRCFVFGCADEMECMDAFGENYSCSDAGICIIACDTLDDCDMVMPDVYDLCDPDFGCVLEGDPFDCNDSGCTEGSVCETDSGACVECLQDSDCEGNEGGPYCDTERMECACMSTDDCEFEIDVCDF